jgi:hypothetical protein
MPARKKVISIEKCGLPVTGEGLIVEVFYFIRVNSGGRDEWTVLHESVFDALKEYFKQWTE